jgi:ketosteroid isomerase-like protein
MSNLADIDRGIRQLYDLFEQRINSGEISSLYDEFFSEDAQVTGHMTPILCGRQAVVAFFGQIHALSTDIRIEMNDSRDAGDTVYNLATTHARSRSSGNPEVLRSLCIFRKTAAGLRCELDFFALADGSPHK